MSPALNGSSALERFKRGNAIDVRNGIMFDFYPGLPYTYRLHERLSRGSCISPHTRCQAPMLCSGTSSPHETEHRLHSQFTKVPPAEQTSRHHHFDCWASMTQDTYHFLGLLHSHSLFVRVWSNIIVKMVVITHST